MKENLPIPMTKKEEQLFGIDKLKVKRSQIASVTHVDYTACIQTVHKETNPRYYDLTCYFEALTSCGEILISSSFNVRGEPSVCTPKNAYRCFMRTEMDYWVLENLLLTKFEQPQRSEDNSWKKKIDLD